VKNLGDVFSDVFDGKNLTDRIFTGDSAFLADKQNKNAIFAESAAMPHEMLKKAFQGLILLFSKQEREIDRLKKALDKAGYDVLTGLPARARFDEQARDILLTQKPDASQSLKYIMLDLDGFKEINDTGGHEAGDRALEFFAEKIQEQLPEEAVFGRVGGDEFAIIMKWDGDNADLRDNLRQGLWEPFSMREGQFALGASIGIASFEYDADFEDRLDDNLKAIQAESDNGGDGVYKDKEQKHQRLDIVREKAGMPLLKDNPALLNR